MAKPWWEGLDVSMITLLFRYIWQTIL